MALRLQSTGPMGLVAPQHVESSWTRDRTCVTCIGRWVLIYWTIRETLVYFLCLGNSFLPQGYKDILLSCFIFFFRHLGFPGGSDGKVSVCLQCRRLGFDPWVGTIPWRRKWQPTPVLLPGKFHGQRSLAGSSPWGRKESHTTEWLHFHLRHLSF